MTWAYNNTTTPGVLTSTGGTEASPDSLLAGIAIVQAANTARGYVNGLVGWLQDVEVRAAGSFIRIDPDSQIDLRGSSFINPGNGGVMHDYRSTLIISATTIRSDAALDFETGSTLLCRRQRPNDPSPRIVYNTATRHDYPTILAASTPARVAIDGLDLYGTLAGGASLKVYFGRATVSSVANIRFFNLAAGQFFSSIYNDGYAESLALPSETTDNAVVFNRPVFYRSSATSFGSALRNAAVTMNNPTFLNNCWNGAVAISASGLSATSALSIQYTYQNTFKSGLTPLNGVNVRFTRSRQSVAGSPAWTAPNGVITAMSDAQGQFSAVNLLDAYREGTSPTDLERFNWTAKARSYSRRTAGENIFANRVLYQHSVNMSAGYSEEVQMLDVPYLTLTQAQAAALTGISLVASGATGGTITVSENETVADLWHFYRQWISQIANFDSNDTWSYDGATLNIGAWNVVVNAGATLTGNFATTGSVTNNGTVTGSYTDSGGTRITIRSSDGLALTTRILVNGVDQGEVVQQTSRNIFVGPTTQVRIFAIAYGYQPKIINVTGNNPADYVISLLPESDVDTTLDATTRDAIVAALATGIDANSRIFLSVNADLRQYTPSQVLNALHRFMVVSGGTVAAAALAQNNVNGFSLMRGGFVIRSPGFYGKVADSITAVGNLGILVPLAISVDPSVYLAMPTYAPVEKNTSGIVLQYAPWTQQQADTPEWVAREDTAQAIKSNAGLIPALL